MILKYNDIIILDFPSLALTGKKIHMHWYLSMCSKKVSKKNHKSF